MNRGAWQATVNGVARVRHNLATKPPQCILGFTMWTFAGGGGIILPTALELWVFETKASESLSLYHIEGSCYQHDLSLMTLNLITWMR